MITGDPGPRPEQFLAELTCPLLLLWGTEDPYVPLFGFPGPCTSVSAIASCICDLHLLWAASGGISRAANLCLPGSQSPMLAHQRR